MANSNINFSAEVWQVLQQNVDLMKEVLDGGSSELVGVYLHGSLTMGGFNPLLSDIDYIAVVKNKITLEQKLKLVKGLLTFADNPHTPAKGIEMHVVVQDALTHFQHPAPYEFHYGKDWNEKYRNNEIDLTKNNLDADLAAHVMVTYQRGTCIYGQPIESVFTAIPEEYYWDSIFSDVKNAVEDICDNPVYHILNLCRVLIYSQTKQVMSKIEGGYSALGCNDSQYHSLIKKALAVYEENQPNSQWREEELHSLAKYMLGRIQNADTTKNQ